MKGEDHHGKMMKDFRIRFLVSLIITVPILVLSPTIRGWTGIGLDIPYSSSIILVLAVAIYSYGGYPFLKGTVDELSDGKPGMMTLIGMAITVAFAYSAAVTLGLGGKVFYWELATLVDVMLLGHWIEMRSVMGASGALEKLAEMIPDTAHRKKENGEMEDVPVDRISSGDVLVVKPGEKVPVDGTIMKGSSSIDESMLTGESMPVRRGEGEELIGGSINGDSSLEVRADKVGDESYLSSVMDMIESSRKDKSRTQRFADRAAMWLTITAITTGVITLVTWLFVSSDAAFSIERMATVMVITCPHALGLAIPLVSAVSTSYSARNGLLIRNRTPFESSRKINRVVFDKTGTLTRGSFEVVKVRPLADDMSVDDILSIAASIESTSEHPISEGIMKKVEENGVEVGPGRDMENIDGRGVKAMVEGKEYVIANAGYLDEKRMEYQKESGEGVTWVYLIGEGEVLGSIGLSDEPRPTAREAISRLKDMDVECWMLTGDSEGAAAKVSRELDMDGYFAEVLPDQKSDRIMELQRKGDVVAMVGDGVNDAPALARADVGIAIGSGTDIAADTADIILVDDDPRGVVKVIRYGKRTHSKMIQNLVWAAGYNVFAIPLAAGVLYWAGIMISPAVGAGLMSASTVIVAINARMFSVGLENGS